MSGAPVMALVLTYNSPATLERCLKAIDAQEPRPARVVVIDNDSQPPAAEGVERLGLVTPHEILRQSENTGPAGGHAAGLSHFLASDAELAWVMDDDCEPEPGALASLVAAAETAAPRTDPVYPEWVNTALGRATDYPAWCGFLVSRATVADVGLPRADYFWWMEDTEYLHWRMRRAGYEPLRVREAVVLHHQDRRIGPKASWKFYYEVRNSVYFRLRVQRDNPKRFYRLARALGGAALGCSRGPNRLERSRLCLRGLLDGLLGRLGPRPGLPPRPT